MSYGVYFSVAQQPLVDQHLLTVEASRSQTHHNQQDSSGGVNSRTQRSLPGITQLSQQTVIHGTGGIRTPNPNRRTATDPRLRPRGDWDQRGLHKLQAMMSLKLLMLVFVKRFCKLCEGSYVKQR